MVIFVPYFVSASDRGRDARTVVSNRLAALATDVDAGIRGAAG
jgi:hypothetical protein